jgi:uncharacterized protein YkwD
MGRLTQFLLLSTLILLANGQGSIRGGDHHTSTVLDEAGSRDGRTLAAASNSETSETSTDPAATFVTGGKKFCIPKDNRTYTLSTDELMNIQWMNRARRSEGLRTMRYGSDLVVEAKRWARYLASTRTLATRDNIFRNIFCGTSNEMGEYVLSTKSVNQTGAFASLMRSDGRDYILYGRYDRVGVGIAKAGSWYYMVMLFKDQI